MDVDTLEEFVAAHSDAETTDNGKVRCTLTGHEMPALLPTVQAYWGGKKYRNTKARSAYDFAQHEPYLVPHMKNPYLLYCTLTKQPLSKEQRVVEAHVGSKRFQKLREGAASASASRSEGIGDGDDDEEAMDDEEELEDEQDEIAEFLGGGDGPFWEAQPERGDDPPTPVKSVEGKGKSRKAAKLEQRDAGKKSPRRDDDDDDDDDAFWVRGAGDAVPDAYRDAAMCDFTEDGELPKKKKKKKQKLIGGKSKLDV